MLRPDSIGNADPTERQAFVEAGVSAALASSAFEQGGKLVTKEQIREALNMFYVASLTDPEMSSVVASLLGNRSSEFRMQVFSNELLRTLNTRFPIVATIILLKVSQSEEEMQ